MTERAAETIIALQTMAAYWSRCARNVMEWCDSHPNNAAGLYDAMVYQARARHSYNQIAFIRGW